MCEPDPAETVGPERLLELRADPGPFVVVHGSSPVLRGTEHLEVKRGLLLALPSLRPRIGKAVLRRVAGSLPDWMRQTADAQQTGRSETRAT